MNRWPRALDVLILVGLLVLPAIALQRRAEEREWRVPEARLHLLELLGGWPGAFLAQRWLRHKCSKGSYQFVFWLIVLAYQFAAFDSLQHWQLSRAALDRLEATSGHRR